MARFFFDIEDGRTAARDETGVELADGSQARKLALQSLMDVACEPSVPEARREFKVAVRGGNGALLGEATLTMALHWTDKS